jgi:hypothetical protein
MYIVFATANLFAVGAATSQDGAGPSRRNSYLMNLANRYPTPKVTNKSVPVDSYSANGKEIKI